MARIDSLMRRALGVAREGARVGGMVLGGAVGRVRGSGAKPDMDDTLLPRRKSGDAARPTAAGTRPRTGRKRPAAEPARVKDAAQSTPDELAARRRGRQPAPIGSQAQDAGNGRKAPEVTPLAERAAGPSAPPSGDGGTGAA